MCDVLLLEDDDLVRGTLASVLEDRDYAVREAATPDEALDIAGSGAGCRVLVTDIDLGASLNGFQVADRMRELAPGTPVLFISGRGWRLRERARATDERTLAKPFSAAGFLAAVDELLARRDGDRDGRPKPNVR